MTSSSYCLVPRRLDRRSAMSSCRQRGVVLVVSLILIVILSLLGTFAIRNAGQSERSINGVRSVEVAREAAETALRFCEQVAIYDGDGKAYSEYGQTNVQTQIISDTTITGELDPNAAWRNPETWKGGGPIQVPATYTTKYSGGSAATDVTSVANKPLCVIQKINNPTTKLQGYLITARGFANNASFDSTTGRAKQGAEAWLQSVLTRPS